MTEGWEKAQDDFKDWYFNKKDLMETTKSLYESLLTSLLIDRDDITNPKIESRIKDRKSCISKFERKYLKDFPDAVTLDDLKTKITDLIGIRIICAYEDEIETVKKTIEENFKVLDTTDKTSELAKNEKFGYKGIHLDVKFSDERSQLPEYKKTSEFQIEIQIRTIIQHAWSSLDHRIIYKHDVSPELNRAVDRLAALFEIADSEFIRIRNETEKEVKDSEKQIQEMEKAAPQLKKTPSLGPLNLMNFYQFLKMKYPSYVFYTHRANSILHEILSYDEQFGLNTLIDAYDKSNKQVEAYRKANENILSMNPYTLLRHILYKYDKEKYGMLLTELQRKHFEDFLEEE